MHWFREKMYKMFRGGVKLYLKTFLEFKVWGREHIPQGAKIYCSNHFSSTDPFFSIAIMKEPVHMIIGPGFSVPVFKSILKFAEQINALPENRKEVIPQAVQYLKRGESVYIFPEGDLNDQRSLKKFYSGLARIYLEYPVPIVPIGIISPLRYVKERDVNIKIGETVHKTLTVMTGKYYANIGPPLDFSRYAKLDDKQEAVNKITEESKVAIEELIDDIKVNKFWS